VTKYLVLFTFKGETLKSFMNKPSDRAAVVGEAAQSVGGRLESYYWMLGQYDGLAILDMPDSAAAARLAMTVSSTGAFTHLETHELFSADQVLQLMKGAQRVEYAAPGQSAEYLQHGMP
jgi:uncharacterized protein with GYD domain